MWCSYIFRRLLCHMLWDCPGTHCAELRGELSWHFPSFPRKGCGWTSATRPTWLSTVTLLLGGTCTCSELPTNRPEGSGCRQRNRHVLAEGNAECHFISSGCRLDHSTQYQNTPETLLDSYAANQKIIRNMAGGLFSNRGFLKSSFFAQLPL